MFLGRDKQLLSRVTWCGAGQVGKGTAPTSGSSFLSPGGRTAERAWGTGDLVEAGPVRGQERHLRRPRPACRLARVGAARVCRCVHTQLVQDPLLQMRKRGKRGAFSEGPPRAGWPRVPRSSNPQGASEAPASAPGTQPGRLSPPPPTSCLQGRGYGGAGPISHARFACKARREPRVTAPPKSPHCVSPSQKTRCLRPGVSCLLKGPAGLSEAAGPDRGTGPPDPSRPCC